MKTKTVLRLNRDPLLGEQLEYLRKRFGDDISVVDLKIPFPRNMEDFYSLLNGYELIAVEAQLPEVLLYQCLNSESFKTPVLVPCWEEEYKDQWPLKFMGYVEEPVWVKAPFERMGYVLEEFRKLLENLPPEARVLVDNLPYTGVVGWPFVRGDGSAGMQTRTRVWDGAFAIALDEETHKVFVIRQTRATEHGPVKTIEIPGGGIDPGDSPLGTAIQELIEEAGVFRVSDEIVRIGPMDGFNPIDGLIWTGQHAFLFPMTRKEIDPEPGHEVELMTLSELIDMDNQDMFRDPFSPYILRRAQDWLRENIPVLLT